MGLFTIDESRCTGDGLCAAECPVRIITDPEGGRFPAPVENAEELCIECGHCVAVCPYGAFTHRALRPDECVEISRDLAVGPDRAEQFLAARRSIRSYREKPVERETMERLIRMCRNAPTGHNSRLTEWMVVRDPADVRRYSGMTVDWMRFMLKEHPTAVAGLHMDLVVKAWEEGTDRVCRGAPHLVIAHGPAKNPMTRDSCTIAVTYLELAAYALDLGACWAGYVNFAAANWPPLHGALAFPEGNNAFGAMMIGYPKYRYPRIPRRGDQKIIWA